MNIKQHIDAGHYPKDDKGRALVPLTGGLIAIILCTDAPGKHSIIGYVCYDDAYTGNPYSWRAIDGKGDFDGLNIKPPAPVEITRYMISHPVFGDYYYSTIDNAVSVATQLCLDFDSIIVLTGKRKGE